MHTTSKISALIAAVLLAGVAGADDTREALAQDSAAELAGIHLESKLLGHSVYGGGYADFTSGGAPGENSYWVFAQGFGPLAFGRWYADVFIDFPTTDFVFKSLYTVDCIEVDRATKQAWIDGTIIESNNPANVGRRAFLYIKDGGFAGPDFHAITTLAAGVNCKQRPAPNFMEQAQSGNYFVER